MGHVQDKMATHMPSGLGFASITPNYYLNNLKSINSKIPSSIGLHYVTSDMVAGSSLTLGPAACKVPLHGWYDLKTNQTGFTLLTAV